MALRDEITALFSQGYDAFRRDVLGEETNLRLFDDDGVLVRTLTTGWIYEEQTEEQGGGRSLELRIADTGDDLTEQEFFGFHGIKYQREGQVNPPKGNPKEWIFTVRPIGIDDVAAVQFVLGTSGGEILVDDFGNGLAVT